jgi:ParB family transcriptional regulator, chromosome partitioning protein
MADKRPALGRGLSALIPEAPPAPAAAERALDVDIDLLRPNRFQPRTAIDGAGIEELARSIKSNGLIQPIVVRKAEKGYEIVAGERRWRAAQRIGLHDVPVIVRELSDQEAAEFALIENVQRTDLNPIEEATGYSELIEKFGYTQEELGEVIGKSRSHLANMLRLLRLPTPVRTLVQDGKLTAGHARALIGREDAESLARRIVEEDLNVREVEALVQDGARGGGGGKSGRGVGQDKDVDSRAFEKDMSDSLGLKVEIKPGSGESGTLSIKYGNFDQLDYIRSRLVGRSGD